MYADNEKRLFRLNEGGFFMIRIVRSDCTGDRLLNSYTWQYFNGDSLFGLDRIGSDRIGRKTISHFI